MSPKRILLISYHTCPLASEEGKETGGMNIYVYELGRHLASLGHTVDAVTRYQSANEARSVEVSERFRVIHLPAGPVKSVDKKRLVEYIPEFVTSLQEFITAEHISYDVIHAHYYQSGLIGLELKKRYSIVLPIVMTFHTLALMKNLVARTPSEQESIYRVKSEFRLANTCNAIIAPSVSDQQYLQYLFSVPMEKIFRIPPGVNTDIFKPCDQCNSKKEIGMNPNDHIIMFVGRIEPLKGIDVLLYALKILIVKNPHLPVKLLIVGGDISQHISKWSAQLRELTKIRKILGLVMNVQFVGQKQQHELVKYYTAADVVVMPSHYESFGMAAAEAMACGTPVITTNATGISNRIDEKRDSLISSANNPLLLASQIENLFTHEDLYSQVKKDALMYVSDLRWPEIASRIDRVYDAVINNEK